MTCLRGRPSRSLVLCKPVRLLTVLLGGHLLLKISVLLFVNTDSLVNFPFARGQGRTHNKPCFNYTGYNSSESGLSLEMFRRLADEGARLFEEFPDRDVVLCSPPGLDEEVWRGVQDLIQRRALLQKTCRANPSGLRLPVTQLDEAYVMKPLSVVFCGNPKAGTTTWKSHLLRWMNYTTADSNVGQIHDETYDKSWHGSSTDKFAYIREHRPLTFFVTRHPHERLVSAYRDKIQRPSEEKPAFKERMYRSAHGKTLQEVLNDVDEFIPDDDLWFFDEISSTVISFPEFVRYFIKKFRECGGLPSCVQYHHSHWWPMYINCPPCDVDYDIITKTESHDIDYAVMEHILLASNFIKKPTSSWDMGIKNQAAHDEAVNTTRTGNLNNKDNFSNSSICLKRGCRLNSTIEKDKTRDNVIKYLRQLTSEERKYLDEIFFYDFLLFGFNANKYN